MQADPQRAQDATLAYDLRHPELSPITVGHINETYLVRSAGDRFVLQRLNPIFDARVHLDIDAITKHLDDRDVLTPLLVPTRDGQLWTEDVQGGVWRMMTFIEGQVFTAMNDTALCSEAGRLLGAFHAALSDMQHTFSAKRLGVHDTPRHLKGLRDAVDTLTSHVAHAEVAAIAAKIFAMTDDLPDLHKTVPRIVHGDPKLSNIIFGQDGKARAFVDLDTLADMPLCLELGDALRSWCNPGGEVHGEFSLPFFEAALRGYAKGAEGFMRVDEIALLPAALPSIALELAARFARDALEESYFGWDRTQYTAAWQHNTVRARSQVDLAYAYAEHTQDAEALIKRVF
jgi:Ser/Thr protein kinase RdoA (MazF antagonist)